VTDAIRAYLQDSSWTRLVRRGEVALLLFGADSMRLVYCERWRPPDGSHLAPAQLAFMLHEAIADRLSEQEQDVTLALKA
jgi:hypothetical protein